MPTLIVAHSESLCNFLVPLLVGFSPAQTRHALNCIEALLVCLSKHKTLTALTRLLRLPHADEFALADFFRASHWDAEALRLALLTCLLQLLVRIQQRTGWRLLFVRIDDALCVKDLATTALEPVSMHYDHNRPRRQKGNFSNSSLYVTLSLQLGPLQFMLTWRLYLSRTVVKRLNRQRDAQQRLSYVKLATLVEQMLDEAAPLLPKGCGVYVLFDAWYDNQHLHKHIRAHAWHWICATRSNRVLNGRPLCHWWPHLGYQRITRVVVRSATRSHTYATRFICGRLRRYPEPVIAIISKRKRRDAHPAYFLCSDTRLSVRTILKYYGYRWQAEIVFPQMTKTDMFATGAGGDHVANLHLVVGDDHTVDQQFYQLPFLLKSSLCQDGLYTPAEIFNRGHQTGQFQFPISAGIQLLGLLVQGLQLLFQVSSPTLVLGERDDLAQISFGQAFQLLFETESPFTQLRATGL